MIDRSIDRLICTASPSFHGSSHESLKFFASAHQVLDLAIVLLDVAGTILILVLARQQSSNSFTALLFAKAGRALRLARLARWLRVIAACIEPEKTWIDHTADHWVSARDVQTDRHLAGNDEIKSDKPFDNLTI